jgi:MFS family permease
MAGLRGFFAPFARRDFFWVFATRFLVQLGLVSIYTFITLYFRDVIGGKNYGFTASLWLLTALAGAVIPAALGGYLSDRMGKRKLFVYISSALQGGVVLLVAFRLVQSLPLMYLLGLVYGVGYGAYYAVDWALACDVLPDRERSAGKDMALWHTSLTVPQVLGPALLAAPLAFLNASGHAVFGMSTGHFLGFRFLFGVTAIFFVLGTVLVSQIRGVR